jgi:hypothetical protein
MIEARLVGAKITLYLSDGTESVVDFDPKIYECSVEFWETQQIARGFKFGSSKSDVAETGQRTFKLQVRCTNRQIAAQYQLWKADKDQIMET